MRTCAGVGRRVWLEVFPGGIGTICAVSIWSLLPGFPEMCRPCLHNWCDLRFCRRCLHNLVTIQLSVYCKIWQKASAKSRHFSTLRRRKIGGRRDFRDSVSEIFDEDDKLVAQG